MWELNQVLQHLHLKTQYKLTMRTLVESESGQLGTKNIADGGIFAILQPSDVAKIYQILQNWLNISD